jgi:hypothetical protein
MPINSFPILDFYPASISYSPRSKSLVANERYTGLLDINRDLYFETPFVYQIEYKNLTKIQKNRIVGFFEDVDLFYPFLIFLQYKPVIVNFTSSLSISQDLYHLYNVSFSVENYYGDTDTYSSNNKLISITNSELLSYNNLISLCTSIFNAETETSRVNLLSSEFNAPSGNYILEINLHMFSGIEPFVCTCSQETIEYYSIHYVPITKLKVGYNSFIFQHSLLDNYVLIFHEPFVESKFALNMTLLAR